MFAQLSIVPRGVEELRFECKQQRPVQARRPEEALPGGLGLHRIGRPIEPWQQALLGPLAVNTEERDQSGRQQDPAMPEPLDSYITQLGERGSDIRGEPVAVVGLSLEPEVDKCLRDVADGGVDGLGDGLPDRFAIAPSDPRVLVQRQAQDTLAHVKQDALVSIDRLGRSLQPPCDAMREFLHHDVRHGLQARGRTAPASAGHPQSRPAALQPAASPSAPNRRSPADRQGRRCRHRRRTPRGRLRAPARAHRGCPGHW